MHIRYTSAVLFVSNLQQMRRFYEDTLKQEVEFDFGACIQFKAGFSLWKPGKAHPTRKIKKLWNSRSQIELCFETEDFEGVKQTLEQINVRYLHSQREEPWGQYTIRFFDPEKNLIEIGESMHGFVKRMQKNGMTAEAIADKTGIALTNIWEIVTE